MDQQMEMGVKGLYVTLQSSDNKYLTYPCQGYLQILELGTHGGIIHAVFRGKNAVTPVQHPTQAFHAPVEVKNPVFTYDPAIHGHTHFMECRAQWEKQQTK